MGKPWRRPSGPASHRFFHSPSGPWTEKLCSRTASDGVTAAPRGSRDPARRRRCESSSLRRRRRRSASRRRVGRSRARARPEIVALKCVPTTSSDSQLARSHRGDARRTKATDSAARACSAWFDAFDRPREGRRGRPILARRGDYLSVCAGAGSFDRDDAQSVIGERAGGHAIEFHAIVDQSVRVRAFCTSAFSRQSVRWQRIGRERVRRAVALALAHCRRARSSVRALRCRPFG